MVKGRLLRVLTAAGYVAEEGDGLYGATHWTSHISSRLTQGMVNFMYDVVLPSRATGMFN
jgi:uncharacterized membrane protein